MPHNLIPVQGSAVPLLKFQMAPRLKLLISSVYKKKEPRGTWQSEAKASHSQRMWAEVSSSAAHLLCKGLLLSPIKWRCFLRLLCPVRRSVVTLDCVLLKDKSLVSVHGLGPKEQSRYWRLRCAGMRCCAVCEKYTVASVLRDQSFRGQRSERSSGEVAMKMIVQNVSNLSPSSTVSHLQQHRHKSLKPQNVFTVFQYVSYQVGYDSSLMNVRSDMNMYTRVNKNPSAWSFLSPKPEVTCGTVAIIIRVVLLSPYLRIRAISLSSIHYNQSHRVHINRRRQYICLIWN